MIFWQCSESEAGGEHLSWDYQALWWWLMFTFTSPGTAHKLQSWSFCLKFASAAAPTLSADTRGVSVVAWSKNRQEFEKKTAKSAPVFCCAAEVKVSLAEKSSSPGGVCLIPFGVNVNAGGEKINSRKTSHIGETCYDPLGWKGDLGIVGKLEKINFLTFLINIVPPCTLCQTYWRSTDPIGAL